MAEEFRVGLRTNADGAGVGAALDRASVAISKRWIDEMADRGYLFHVQQGDAGTKLDFAETAYDEDQPQFALRVPSGKVVTPVLLAVTLEDLAGTENHVIWSVTTNDIGDGTSTGLTINPVRTDAPRDSGCTARSLYTVNATAATGLREVKRWYRPFASAAATDGGRPEDYLWAALAEGIAPRLVGPATLQLHVYGGTAPAGFGEYYFVARDKNDVI